MLTEDELKLLRRSVAFTIEHSQASSDREELKRIGLKLALKSNSNKQNLLLCGKMRVGKSEVGNILEALGYQQFAFGTKIKELTEELFGLSPEDKDANRSYYQEIGKLREKFPTVWIDYLWRKTSSVQGNCVITDGRLPEEVTWALKKDYRIVHVIASRENQLQRIRQQKPNFDETLLDDATETGLDNFPMPVFATVVNDESMQDLVTQVLAIHLPYRYVYVKTTESKKVYLAHFGETENVEFAIKTMFPNMLHTPGFVCHQLKTQNAESRWMVMT